MGQVILDVEDYEKLKKKALKGESEVSLLQEELDNIQESKGILIRRLSSKSQARLQEACTLAGSLIYTDSRMHIPTNFFISRFSKIHSLLYLVIKEWKDMPPDLVVGDVENSPDNLLFDLVQDYKGIILDLEDKLNSAQFQYNQIKKELELERNKKGFLYWFFKKK